ncbi:hypothetical protein D3C86_1535910 [compost metagenome]
MATCFLATVAVVCTRLPWPSIVFQRFPIIASMLLSVTKPLVNSTLLAFIMSLPITKLANMLRSNCLYLNCWLMPPENFGLALPMIVRSFWFTTPSLLMSLNLMLPGWETPAASRPSGTPALRL